MIPRLWLAFVLCALCAGANARDSWVDWVSGLEDPSWFVRMSSVEALAREAPGRTDPRNVVMGLLKHPQPAVRGVVVSSLSRWKLDRRTTFRGVAQGLRDEDPMVRLMAIEVAGGIGTPEGQSLIPALYPLLQDPEPSLRSYAALALAILEYHEIYSPSPVVLQYE